MCQLSDLMTSEALKKSQTQNGVPQYHLLPYKLHFLQNKNVLGKWK
jgi:hypothetical protein